MELISSDLMPADIFILHKWKPSLMEENFRMSRTTKKIGNHQRQRHAFGHQRRPFRGAFWKMSVKQDYAE